MKGSIIMEKRSRKNKINLLKTMLFTLGFSACIPQMVNAEESPAYAVETELEQIQNTMTGIIKQILSRYESVKKTIDEQQKLPEKELEETKWVALTLDDGPGIYTDEFLTLFEENDVHATFFLVGTAIEKRPENVVAISEAGHEIGIHGYTHTSFTKLGTEGTFEEIEQVNTLLESLGLERSTIVRPPYGSFNTDIGQLDYYFFHWNLDTLDWESRDKEKIKEAILKDIDNNSIILVHEIHYETLEALQELIPELKEQGYEFVTLSDLFELNNQNMETGTLYRHVPEIEKQQIPITIMLVPIGKLRKKQKQLTK